MNNKRFTYLTLWCISSIVAGCVFLCVLSQKPLSLIQYVTEREIPESIDSGWVRYMSVFLCVWIPTFLLNEVSHLWLYWRSLHFSARSPVLLVLSVLQYCSYFKSTVDKMQICSIRGNEWRTSRNSSLFYFVFFHFSRHKIHLPHLSFILLFTPCNIIAWPSYCWPICVYVSVCMSPTAPLCPSSLAWLLSCEERFLLVFGIRGNTSFHEEPSVYGDHSAPPTPHSSPFPYITLSATASPVFFFCL